PSLRLRAKQGRQRLVPFQASLGLRADAACLPVSSTSREDAARPEPSQSEVLDRDPRVAEAAASAHAVGGAAPGALLPVNILYLCHRIPFPPDKGDKIRAYHQIEALGVRHRVHVATFIDSPEDERHVPELAKRCAELILVRR